MSHNSITRRFSALCLGVLAACSSSADRNDPDAAAAPFRVALLTPGPISDQSWNGGAYAGLQRIRDSLGAQISHIQTKTPAEFEENFRQYAAQGYALVIGHGFEYQDAAKRVAPSFPKTVFVCTSGRATAPNLGGIAFAFEEAAYQAGMVAGALTKSGTLGLIGGTQLPPVVASFAAFEEGAKRERANARVLTSYIGNWDDVSAAKEQALAQLTQGADVLLQNADAAGLGVFQAVRERKGAVVFGSNANQNGVAPDVIIGSVVIDVPHALLTVARDVKQGGFAGKVYELGMRDDVVRLEFNDQLAGRIPPAVRSRVDSVGAAIRAGTFRPAASDSPVLPASAPR
ncbi:MAG: BMP family protein [Gemmatimonadaceae bacterium]|jgi:basic membrane lipoprotein Med (substrate-binding protein (PBP1-ABC) superfamily)|nr:BMP family protein [Gemmatimonadaceae bacterium]